VSEKPEPSTPESSKVESRAALDGDPVYDLQATMTRLDGDRELFQNMVAFYLEDYPPLLARLQAAIADGRSAEVERAAHSLKGLAGNFGASRAHRAAQRIEELGREGNLVGAAHVLPTFADELHRLRDALTGSRLQAPGSR
jgi:HPt (histidine-containing phosphotransfer) domain-containing protein